MKTFQEFLIAIFAVTGIVAIVAVVNLYFVDHKFDVTFHKEVILNIKPGTRYLGTYNVFNEEFEYKIYTVVEDAN